MISENTNQYFVMELSLGFVVIGDHQFYPGYTLLLLKEHKTELHQIEIKKRLVFLKEMSIVAEAVFNVFQPKKLNYELLGNKDSHIHWHIYPRYKNDPDPLRPVWSYPKEKRVNNGTKASGEFINKWSPKLKVEITKLTKKYN